ncbi:hypothetical protein HYO65_gp280 [Tenacibaculum phage PTm1]|uniref:Uncharacterized protein n=2 Tax=Shirahamavirus PTm1 TaxID=2846435 RepID=A0A5S9HYB9_9CAUD|nr:hypothetical protein HYO65_gp280 [Tenacibaculum phage PTm1]BBI90672.1 hypothetical protein [Tenacibaculum phage PTm1]BBI90977.1 hypothetical protein [Tenacibaculum phage PTm5]
MKFFDCNKHKWQDCECTTECRRGNKELKTEEHEKSNVLFCDTIKGRR